MNNMIIENIEKNQYLKLDFKNNLLKTQLNDSASNSIFHFKYTPKAIWPLTKIQ